MKKFLNVLLISVCLANCGFGQDSCTVYITASQEASCMLTDYSVKPIIIDNNLCFLACKGSSITYTAKGMPASNYEWIIGGALNYTIISGGSAVNVTWRSDVEGSSKNLLS